MRNDINNLFLNRGIKVKPIYKLCIIRFADYTVCKSVLLLYLDIKINYKCYFLIKSNLKWCIHLSRSLYLCNENNCHKTRKKLHKNFSLQFLQKSQK